MIFPPAGQSKSIAFIGDSISTGAVTNPALTFDKQNLWEIFRGKVSIEVNPEYFEQETGRSFGTLRKPVRLWPSLREYFGPSSYAGNYLVNAFSTVYLDTEQYSWAYILARELGYAHDQILIAAQDGSRIEGGIRQIDRVLNHTGGAIPEKLFIFFTGNDLCGHSIEMTKSADQYAEDLTELLDYLIRNGTERSGGSDIFVLGFMGIMQLTTSPEILDKKVNAHGKPTTCREFANISADEVSAAQKAFLKKNPEANWFMAMFPSTPAAMCPTVFGLNPDKSSDQKATLANRIRSIRKKSLNVVNNFSKKIKIKKKSGSLRFYYVDGTGDLLFDADDIAADCFHLSLKGQSRIANVVKESLSNFSK